VCLGTLRKQLLLLPASTKEFFFIMWNFKNANKVKKGSVTNFLAVTRNDLYNQKSNESAGIWLNEWMNALGVRESEKEG